MAGREPDELELEAAAVLATHLGGKDEVRDCGNAHGAHDFDIHLPDGRCVALEVTSIADHQLVSFHNALSDGDWAARELASDWWVGLRDPDGGDRPIPRVKREKGAIIGALAVLERHQIRELERGALEPWVRLPESTPAAVRGAIEKLVSIGVVHVRSTGHAPDGVAHLLFSTHGGVTSSSEQLNDLVAERAQAKHRKLAAATASERHLFIWLTGTYADAELAFSTLPPPATSPEIPACIDVVWLATPSNGGPNRMWKLRPPSGWGVVDLSFLGKRYAFPPWLRSEAATD